MELEDNPWKAKDIMNCLLDMKLWAFASMAPNLKYMAKDDRAVIYLAGKSNRFFAADFTIARKPYETNLKNEEPNWLALFPIRVEITEVNLWPKHVSIGEIIGELDFIYDKKNYGLYFRQSNKAIEKADFIRIVSAASHKIHANT
ncbi:EVE domain-containing protein [Desulfitobacterium sp. THU1]|uniref:EVE domain-containing protein n=1 Tax=Desulfitobacterium sp. THU1 TaxID=3138072 RepID=UPI00311DEF82